MIKNLPEWVLTLGTPAFYDMETATMLELVSKIQASMIELIDAYNQYETDVNAFIDQFKEDSSEEYQRFTMGVQQAFQDLSGMIELTLTRYEQDMKNLVAKNIEDASDEAVRDLLASAAQLHNQFMSEMNTWKETTIEDVSELNQEHTTTLMESVNQAIEGMGDTQSRYQRASKTSSNESDGVTGTLTSTILFEPIYDAYNSEDVYIIREHQLEMQNRSSFPKYLNVKFDFANQYIGDRKLIVGKNSGLIALKYRKTGESSNRVVTGYITTSMTSNTELNMNISFNDEIADIDTSMYPVLSIA